MSDLIARYGPMTIESGSTGDYYTSMRQQPEGEWVKFADHAAALRQKDREIAELWQHRSGHLPDCAGVNEPESRCGCGYLQGAAYRDLYERLSAAERELAELRAQQPVAWIAVADRLPADLEDVLVYWAPSIPPSVANWNVDRREWCDAFTHNEEDTEPTHWMPLPAKP